MGDREGGAGGGFAGRALSGRAEALVVRVSSNLLGRVRGRLSAYSVVDMLENARRRIADQGRYDDGVARLYRTVEMYHQWRLAERSVNTSNVDRKKMDQEAGEPFLEETGLAELPPFLDLVRARILDRILNGDVPEDDAVLRNLLQQRNHSILAHVLEPIGEKAARLIGDRAHDPDPCGARGGGHRDDRSASAQQEEVQNPGWPQAQALQEALEGRAAVRLARQLPAAGHALPAADAENFLGFVCLGCIVILLGRLLRCL